MIKKLATLGLTVLLFSASTVHAEMNIVVLDSVRAILEESSGTHFDTAVVEAFFEVQDELCAIRQRLAEPEASRLAA